jgi:AcrR family transcriptional regulator
MDVKSNGGSAGTSPPRVRRRRQRADARRSIVAILDSATRVLSSQPEASVEDVAKAAGVSRQTVYAHFPSREALLDAVIKRAAAEATAAFDTASLDQAPPAQALIRLLDAGWQVAGRYPFLWHQPQVSPGEDAERHGPIMDRLLAVIRRGQGSGDFDPGLSPEWLLAAGLALGRAAEDEVKGGRMTIEEATSAVHRSFLRLFGVNDPGAT